jgi:EmrB/QacA subfamily drug resistance transporter
MKQEILPAANNAGETLYPLRWYVLMTVGIGSFLSASSTSITNTILPVIERDLHISLGQSEWVVLIYLLGVTLCLLPVGRLSDILGHRPLFLTGFAGFLAGSLVCGLAHGYLVLLAGRALLSIAGALVLAIGPALLADTFPARQRGQVLGLQAVLTYIGLALGPFIGGWLTQWWGWNAAFFMAVPFSVAGLALGAWATPRLRKNPSRTLDRLGTVYYIVAMAALILLLNSDALSWQRQILLPALFAVFLIFTGLFVRRSLQQSQPLLDFSLFRIRNFGFGSLGAISNYQCIFLVLFLLPFYFDRALRASPATIGTYLTVMPLVMLVVAPLSGAWSDRMGFRWLTVSGMLFATAGLILYAWRLPVVSAQTLPVILIGLVLAGLGSGLFATPNNSAILGAVSPGQRGVASGTLATARYVGMMAGITVGGTGLDFLTHHYAGVAGGSTAFLHAFGAVMWIGAFLGFLGILCSLAMVDPSKRK